MAGGKTCRKLTFFTSTHVTLARCWCRCLNRNGLWNKGDLKRNSEFVRFVKKIFFLARIYYYYYYYYYYEYYYYYYHHHHHYYNFYIYYYCYYHYDY